MNVNPLYAPTVVTKSLRLAMGDGRRRIRISSNLLDLFGFTPGVRLQRRILPGARGFELFPDANGAVSVYARRYGRRTAAPAETLIDVGAESFVADAIPAPIDRVHYTITPGRIVGRPFPERAFHIGRRLKEAPSPFEAFVGLSSGVDAACLAAAGFTLQSLLEFRPQEARDAQDRTESGVITALRNNAFKVVINEDIFHLNWDSLREIVRSQPQVGLMMLSPQCDDFSPLKSCAARVSAIESLQTTRDMAYEALRLVEEVSPACVLIENVPGFGTSPEAEMIALKLRRWGYSVQSQVLDPRDFGDCTSRRRFYLLASIYPGLEFPTPSAQPARPWDAIADQVPLSRDVTDTSSVRKGIATKRIRFLTPESAHAPTVFKSQHRQTKDALYLKTPEGRILFPTLEALQRLNGIPASFKFDAVSAEVATEQIGQSISWGMHHALANAVRAHLALNVSGGIGVTATAISLPASLGAGQMSFPL